jgi:repressor LexA
VVGVTDHLTERQERILRCIREEIVATGEGPSIRRIGQLVGLSSSSSVAYQLGRLEEQGLIARSGRRWRDCHVR